MKDPDSGTVTRLLRAWSAGDRDAINQLMPLVQGELRRQARGYFHREEPGHTLQPTALVNEAYLRLIRQDRVQWQDRAHFFGIAAQIMRRLLVDHARKRHAANLSGYGSLPSYRAMLEREGVGSPAEVCLVGNEDSIPHLGVG